MRAKFWQNNSWVCMSLWWADTNAGVKLVKMMNDPSEGRAGKTEWDPCWGGFPLAVVGLLHWRFGMMGVEMGFGWTQVTVSCSHLSYKFLHRNKSPYLNSAGSKQHGKFCWCLYFIGGVERNNNKHHANLPFEMPTSQHMMSSRFKH